MPGHKTAQRVKMAASQAVKQMRKPASFLHCSTRNNHLHHWGAHELTREVREHNGFAKRMPVVEKDVEWIKEKMAFFHNN